jgi:hypothetical protein
MNIQAVEISVPARSGMTAPTVCPFCGGLVRFRIGKQTAACENRQCDARVGCHPNSNIPLGTLASPRQRQLRQQVHERFDVLWRSHLLNRAEAYDWLSQQLSLSGQETHIGLFDESQCQAVLALMEKLRSHLLQLKL